jgi:predicted DsbA family dithiol-disulfide isomerase/uncharacterized membrane protein
MAFLTRIPLRAAGIFRADLPYDAVTVKRGSFIHWLTLVFVVVALVASAILLVDYVRPAPVFCEAGGGCSKVKETIFARPLGVPLPAIGLLGTLAIGFAALLPGKKARTAQLGLAAFGGLVAAILLIVQARMHTICPFCAAVDASSIVLALLSFARFKEELDPPTGPLVFWAPVVGLVAAIGLPLLIGFSRRAYTGEVPPSIVAEIEKTERGKVTIVDFVDFECPFCRMTNAELEPLLAERRDKVRLVRKHVPLRMHPHALDAAKAGCCGEKMGKGDQMANALFTAPEEELTPEGCEKLAEKLGLDVNEFRKCVSDPSTTERIDADKAAFKAAKGHGLPTIWVDDQKLEGAQDRSDLETAIDGAIHRL